MPRYGLPDKTLRIPLPSDPSAEVWGPGELDFDIETRVLSRSQRTEMSQATGQQITIVDNSVFEYELLHAFLEHRDAGWNLFDENDQPYERTRGTIDRLFRGVQGRSDRTHIISELGKAFFPEMIQQAPAQVVADPNGEQAATEATAPAPQPTPAPPVSETPSVSSPSPESIPATGQTEAPRDTVVMLG